MMFVIVTTAWLPGAQAGMLSAGVLLCQAGSAAGGWKEKLCKSE